MHKENLYFLAVRTVCETSVLSFETESHASRVPDLSRRMDRDQIGGIKGSLDQTRKLFPSMHDA